ncbi:uncharacterized protein EI90DRAFT_3047334 [Cantharellus anzutake]|uniref:uncharacterized protein n=1 Tax=Cantharellus anzutake TaxID=1750568 RepID=UPI0019080237|nr:uncharacterized protein EI90DRAFT_3047334 [Cantharellus anzutake]KAF8335858.1 hypothetical protein EI90DRAFT_3047334 [Cantharellus anzutake]
MTPPIVSCSVGAPSISPELGTRLLVAALSHALYANGQIPFPVGQLASIPLSPSLNASSRSKALRKRDELLDGLDELDGQLSSALMKLSWTLAASTKDTPESNDSASRPALRLSKAHFMILVGTSVGAPKLRVIVELDRFEVKPFGWRDHVMPLDPPRAEVSGVVTDYDGTVEGHSEEDSGSISSSETISGQESDEDAHSQLGTEDEHSVSNSESESESDSGIESRPTLAPSTVIDDGRQSSPASPESNTSHGDTASYRHVLDDALLLSTPATEGIIKKAERALYRALAHTDAGYDDGDDELPPTTSLVLLRAPRSFHQPHWTPRQDYSRSLDLVAQRFFQLGDGGKKTAPLKFAGGMRSGKLRGIKICCQTSHTSGPVEAGGDMGWHDRGSCGDAEADEMIWWQWDGKLRGIGDDMFI